MRLWLKKYRLEIISLILITIISIVILGCIFAPSIFYDNWLWKYYWGPIVADADPGSTIAIHNQVVAVEGYTLVSEITYGLILVLSLFVIYKLLKKLKIVIDWKFCLALMPYILLGPVSRVLEDAEYFNVPFIYWFISPLIYLQIAFFALFFVISGYSIEKFTKKSQNEKIKILSPIMLLLIVNIFVTSIWMYGAKYELDLYDPIIFYLVSCLALIPLIYNYLKNKFISVNSLLFSGGILFLFPSLYLTSKWIAGNQWGNVYSETRFDMFLLIMGLVATIAILVYLIAIRYSKNEKISIFKEPLNLSMIVGHMVDGLTSYISIYDPLKMGLPLYVEKHPASNALMELWPPLFPIVKFLLIVVVIYIFDILYKEELKNYKTFVNLLKIGILILGFSPGTRDLLRVTMGV